MDERYDSYCAVDPLFYDSLSSTTAEAAQFAADRALPEGWAREPIDDWLICGPVGGSLPQQGWKIHVSACVDNAERVLHTIWDYCVARGLPFKFLRGPRMLLMRNAKYARRGSSGKFITIYPRDDAELELGCKDLARLLAGEPGPYILSDLRYGDGPVYVRYGGFAARFCVSSDAQVVPAIADPTGRLVPDRRDPTFHVPDWVPMPSFLAPHLAARSAATTTELPYQIERAMHFSNGGGLYAARDRRTGVRVVLKEARPHAGLDATGADAVNRLRCEARMLRQLADVPQVVRVLDELVVGEHEFLVLEHIDGQPLNRLIVEKYPLVNPGVDTAAYTDWALEVYRQVEEAVTAIHDRGIVYGDLHMFNILVRPDDTVALIDFEVAAPATDPGRPALRNQAFAAPRDRSGVDVDRYALACLRLALFLPLTAIVRLVPAKAAHLADIVAENFPVPRDFLDEAVRIINGVPAPGQDMPSSVVAERLDIERFDIMSWPRLRDQLAGAIDASATPQRDDRLFPGDIEQFRTGGGLNLAYGAAGVLWALHATGAPTRREHVDWLVERALTPTSGSRIGFYDGLHGIAWALQHLGRAAQARSVLKICLDEPWEDLGVDLASGLAGVALNCAYFAQLGGDRTVRDAAWRAVELVTKAMGDEDSVGELSGGGHPYAGLTRGGAGIALMFLRLYELSGDQNLLDRAATALRQDLARCMVREDGAMEVNEGWRSMPYLAHGSAGVGLVVDQYLEYRADEQFAEASRAIRRAAQSPFYAQSGLFAGRAGIMTYLAEWASHQRGEGNGRDGQREARRQAGNLAWHALPYRGPHESASGADQRDTFLAFPGDQLLRLSMDLATGTAGVLLALGAVRHDQPVRLPFLAPLPATVDPSNP